MSDENIRSYTLQQIRAMKGQTNWERLRQDEEADIEPELDNEEVGIAWDWSRAVMVDNYQKKPISLRLDPDVLEFFKADGPGYQTRMNAVLRSFMVAHKAQAAVKKL
jgi:uncharacterized protein (DUF4415 family)